MDDHFIRLTLHAETNTGQEPGMADLERWANAPGTPLTFPILSDGGWSVANAYEVDNYIPSYSLIGRNMEVLILDGSVSGAQISSALDEPIPEVEWDIPPELDSADGIGGGDGESPASQSSPFGGGDAGLDDNGFISPYGGGSCQASMAPGGSWLALALVALLGLVRRR